MKELVVRVLDTHLRSGGHGLCDGDDAASSGIGVQFLQGLRDVLRILENNPCFVKRQERFFINPHERRRRIG